MTGKQRKAHLKRAYEELSGALLRTIYEHDPDGVGAGAPADEYAGEVATLIRALKNTTTKEEIAKALETVVGDPTSALTDEVAEAWGRFEESTR